MCTNKRIHVPCRSGNMTPIVQQILQRLEDHTTLSVEKGEYHFYQEGCYHDVFYPSNNAAGPKDVVFTIFGKKNITIEGNGAEFIFHGKIYPFIIMNCQNFCVQDLSVDFFFPRVYQAEVLDANETYLDLYMDKQKFPYSIVDGSLVLHLEEEDLSPETIYFFPYDAKFDRTYGKIPTRYNMAHYATGAHCDKSADQGKRDWGTDNRQFHTDAVDLGDNRIRLVYREDSNKMFYDQGDRLIMSYQRTRDNGTFFLDRCKDVHFRHVRVYRSGCMGLNAQICENMEFDDFYVGCKEGSGDLIATTADAFMLIDCRGKVTLKNSHLADSLDDGINVHGTYMPITAVSGNTITHILGHVEQEGFNPLQPGDSIAIVDEKSLDITHTFTVVTTQLCEDMKHIVTVVKEQIPETVKAGNIIYNLDGMPEMDIVDNELLNVPALLLGTSKRTYFARNKVNTRNEALRLVDSATRFNEVARKNDLIIEDNEFLHCAEWYDLPVIHIVERLPLEKPKYDIHQNMTFRNNRFVGRNCRWFYIEYSTNVDISGNTFENTDPAVGQAAVKPFEIRGSKHVVIKDNTFVF